EADLPSECRWREQRNSHHQARGRQRGRPLRRQRPQRRTIPLDPCHGGRQVRQRLYRRGRQRQAHPEIQADQPGRAALAVVMAPGRINLSVADARDLAEGALRGIGFYDAEARIVADHVIDAALCGYEYSGLPKILNLPESERFKRPRRPMTVLRETDVSIAFDGGNNVGMLSLYHAAEATIRKCEAYGVALVSVTDAWMSGRSAYYVEMIAN